MENTADIEKMIKHENGQYCVYSADGSKKLGCHPTKKDAIAQLIAVEENKVNKDDNQKLHDAQAARSKKYGIQILADGALTPPAGNPNDESEYGDPVNYKYPINDRAHAANAKARFEQNKDAYDSGSAAKVLARIEAAEKKHGVEAAQVNKNHDMLDQVMSLMQEALAADVDGDAHPAIQAAIDALQQTMDAYAQDENSQQMAMSIDNAKVIADHLNKANAGAPYPFEQCVSDRQKDGYDEESARRICAYIGRQSGAIKSEDVKKSVFTTSKNEKGEPTWALDFEFQKLNEEQQLVGGVVYEPDVVDAQGDSAGPLEILKAAHRFMLESKTLGLMHKEATGPRAQIVENYIAPESFRMGKQMIKKGSWVMVVKILDKNIWDQVKKGELTGFSMGGRAREEAL